MIWFTNVSKWAYKRIKLPEQWYTAKRILHLGVGVVFVLLDLDFEWFEEHALANLHVATETEVHDAYDVQEQELGAIRSSFF